MAKAEKGGGFEAEMDRVKEILARMEDGDLGLEDSLKAFEDGVRRLRRCREILASVETRVRLATEEGDRPFAAGGDGKTDAEGGAGAEDGKA